MRVGCKVGGVSINNISYADDMVLLGPTARSIQEMLLVCERYAASHGLTYNIKKSEYMVFKAAGGMQSKIYTSGSCEVRLRIEAGWVCGRVRDAEDGTKYFSFRGIPYAKPPLGVRRFKELEPPDPWDYLLDATEDGTACPHLDYGYSRMVLQLKGMSEDCIHLNLHMPCHIFSQHMEHSGVVGAPILVFVHGGAFQQGSSLTDLHGPEYLMMNDLVVITFNYRIGPLGFLSLDTEQIPGNQGLRDVVTLLKWVQRNARAFGGNPDDVTLMGHSSGSTMAHLISLSEAVEGLIHKVILMGGNAITSVIPTSNKHAMYMTNEFLQALGINSTDKEYIAKRLYKEPILNIIYAANVVRMTADLENFVAFAPVVESKFPKITRVLDDDPHTLIAKGRGKLYPLLSGFTNAEYQYFKWMVIPQMASNPMRLKTKAKAVLPAHMVYDLPEKRQLQIANQIRNRYFNGTSSLDEILAYMSDMVFIYPALKVAEWRAMVGAPVYLYQFSYEAIKSIIKEAQWYVYKGVAHVEDLTYVFRVNSMLDKSDKAIPPKNTDDLMRCWMSSFIAKFVMCSTPTCVKGDNRWPEFRTMQYQDIRFPTVYDMRNLTNYQREMVAFFDSIDYKARYVQETLSRLISSRDTLS